MKMGELQKYEIFPDLFKKVRGERRLMYESNWCIEEIIDQDGEFIVVRRLKEGCDLPTGCFLYRFRDVTSRINFSRDFLFKWIYKDIDFEVKIGKENMRILKDMLNDKG